MEPVSRFLASFFVVSIMLASFIGSAHAWTVPFPGGEVRWGPGYGGVRFPYGDVQWGYRGGRVNFPGGAVTWGPNVYGKPRSNKPFSNKPFAPGIK